MPARHDYSAVPPLGAYVAKRCPVRVQLEHLGLEVEEVPLPADVVLRMEQGNAFEAAIVASLYEVAGPDWAFVDEAHLSPAAARAATMSAIADRAPVIVGANLEADFAAKRAGKPDLLLWDEDGYVPVDIKHHLTLDALAKGAPAVVSELAAPAPAAATADPLRQLRRNKDDALQLAHYRRMLEALEVAATGQWGGIIGKEGRIVWYSLAAPMWRTPAKSDGKKVKQRTTLAAYDFEFEFRRDIAAVALQHQADAATELLVEPMRCSDCPSCPWLEVCNATLLEASGDASLLPQLAYPQWRALRNAAITDRAGVAGLDLATAELIESRVDVARWLEDAATADPATAVAELRPQAKKQIATLGAAGIATAGDIVARLDPATARFGSWIRMAILNARAATGPEPVYLLPGGVTTMPRSDIEIDVDMESTNDGVYMWGAYVTDRAGTAITAAGYRAFAAWEPPTPDTEAAVFREFWDWLAEVRHRAATSGHTVAAYCWHEGAENREMRRITAGDAAWAGEVAAFIASDEWVDMEKVFKAGWITGEGTSLKTIAPLAGHVWEVDDPGGGLSMVRFAEAIGNGPEAGQARSWLETYNRGDVEATAAIREWLAGRVWD
jgi:predicted RecB family nuclease